jgi:hypothetical protein
MNLPIVTMSSSSHVAAIILLSAERRPNRFKPGICIRLVLVLVETKLAATVLLDTGRGIDGLDLAAQERAIGLRTLFEGDVGADVGDAVDGDRLAGWETLRASLVLAGDVQAVAQTRGLGLVDEDVVLVRDALPVRLDGWVAALVVLVEDTDDGVLGDIFNQIGRGVAIRDIGVGQVSIVEQLARRDAFDRICECQSG